MIYHTKADMIVKKLKDQKNFLLVLIFSWCKKKIMENIYLKFNKK